MTDTRPPRRKWHLTRWFFVFAFVAMAWSGWRAYAFRSALAQAKALGWYVEYNAPVETIRNNWKAAFEKATWLDGVRMVSVPVPAGEPIEQRAIMHRLNPKELNIRPETLRDLTALKALSRLRSIYLTGYPGLADTELTNLDALKDVSTLEAVRVNNCTGLTSVDALMSLPRLQTVSLSQCRALTNVDALKNLSALQMVLLQGCAGLTNVDALKNLSALRLVSLDGCTGLTNVDALKNLSALQRVYLEGCTGLTNVDALKNLPALQSVLLIGCTGLRSESVAALRAALPNARIIGP